MINDYLYNFWYLWSKSQSTNFLNKKTYVDNLIFMISNCCPNNKWQSKEKNILRRMNIKKKRTAVDCFLVIEFFLYLQYLLVWCTNSFYQVLTIHVKTKIIDFAKFVIRSENKTITSSINLWFTIINLFYWKWQSSRMNNFKMMFVKRCVLVIVFQFTIVILILW